MGAITRFLTVTAATKRAPVLASGKRGAPAVQVASLKCTPLDPVDPELRQRLALDTPHEVLQTFTQETNIFEGDLLTVAGVDYPIRSCAEWTWQGTTFRHLVLENLKR